MAAQLVDPTPEVAELLKQFQAAGGVLKFFYVAVDDMAACEKERHRIAADLGLRHVLRENEEWGEAVVRHYGGIRDDYFRVTIPQGYTPTGHSVSVDDFIGPMFSRHGGFQRREANCLDEDAMLGLAYALMEPPYTLKDSKEFFLLFKRTLFANFPDDMVIYAWETDGLNYFDAGREWWGTFFWTVQISKNTPIITILGSSTD